MLKTAVCALALIITITSAAVAQPAALVLSPEDEEALVPEAQEAFQHAVQTLYADPLESFDSLAHAAELNPEILQLQSITADFAMSLVVQTSSPESHAIFLEAVKAAENIAANPEATPLLLNRIQRRLDMIRQPAITPQTPDLIREIAQRLAALREQIDARLAEIEEQTEDETEPATQPMDQ
jgi:hypothetical protein